MSQNINWTSPREWPMPMKVAVGGTVVIGAGAALMYLLSKNDAPKVQLQMEDIEFESKTVEEKAQILKNQGNKLFQSRNYTKATETFARAIEYLKSAPDSEEKNSNLAILYNNFSACMEFQNDLNAALEYTTRAITLNPDYIKPYVRRSRIYKLKKDHKSAVKDLAKIFNVHANTKDSEKHLAELFEVTAEILKSNVERMYLARIDAEQFLPISQANLMEWMYQTVVHDPILKLLPAVNADDDADESGRALDLALYYLKRNEYEKVIPFAINSLVDKFMSDRERYIACLLLARMYQFAGLVKQFKFVYEKLDEMWNDSTEEFKANNVDLLMSLFTLKIVHESPEIVEVELRQNLELCSDNADPFLALFMTYYNLANGEKAIEMLELAKKVEPNRKYIEYHEMSAKFLKATQNQDLLSLHNLTAEMDRQFNDIAGVPEFAILNAARIFHTVQNTQLSLELMRKYSSANPERSIIFEYLYAVLSREVDQDRQNATENLVKDLDALAARDSHNFEINRLLFRCHLAKDNDKAADAAEREWLNTRGLDEFTAAYHDVIIGFALAGREIPMDDWTSSYVGPDYIRANSEDNAMKLTLGPITQ